MNGRTPSPGLAIVIVVQVLVLWALAWWWCVQFFWGELTS